jgi:hypothetical protein
LNNDFRKEEGIMSISPLQRIVILLGCIQGLGQLLCYLSPLIIVWWFLLYPTGLLKNPWLALLMAVVIHCLSCFGLIIYITKRALATPSKKKKFAIN